MASKFQRVLEQATDSTLVEPNWEGIIACTDMIRSNEVAAKPSLQAIRKRLQHENPHVVNHTLLVLDACVKNCGHRVHSEVATREFMEDFKNLVTESKYDEVKNKSLEMLQCWATAFANKPEYKMVVDTHNLMKLAGFDFPSMKEADAMFMAQVAPEWAEGPECYRCRSVFTVFTRKHHCRACGQIFCDKCSSREMTLPQFGIEKDVRVCETCFEKRVTEIKENHPLMKRISAIKDQTKNDANEKATKEKLLREKEEEDLALAIAISQSEAEAKEKEKQNNLYSMYNGIKPEGELGVYKGVAENTQAPPPEDNDPLARYLNRDYWQQKKEGKVEEWASNSTTGYISASAPPPSEPSVAPSICSTLVAPDDNSLNADIAAMSLGGTNGVVGGSVGDDVRAQADDTMRWCQSIRDQVSVMDNRIRSNLARGRPVFNDSAIQDLFTKLTELHSHVLSRMHTLDEQRGYYESLQDHLANIGEARQAINEMREEHERKRQEQLAEEQRMRQAQMQQTLEMMRMKKHAMLMEQREQALQRFQQQQQEMALRRQQQAYYNPQMGAYGAVQPPPPPPSSQPPAYYGYQQQGQSAPNQYQPPPQQQIPQTYYQHYPGAPAAAPSSNGHQQQYEQQYHQQYYQQQQQQAYQQPQQQGYPLQQHQQQQHAHQQGYQNGVQAQENGAGQYSQQQQHHQQSEMKPEQGYRNEQNGYGNVDPNASANDGVHHQHQQALVSEQPLISFD
uniref:Hepatocyte growth factor-regulated tyrosine kinase substrate n=1 Tax=Caenorhabditis japonica TaxID=281687 RepID=A0A8R1DII4_CAEJA